MRLVWAAFSAATLLIAISTSSIQGRPLSCSSYNVSFDNGTGKKVADAWVLTRPVLKVTVTALAAGHPNGTWSVAGPATSTSPQAFGDKVSLNLDGSPVTTFQINVADAATQCTLQYKVLRLARPSQPQELLAFVASGRGHWSDKPLDIVFPKLLALAAADVRFDGTAFYATGQLQIGQALRTRSDVSVKIDDESVSLISPVSIAVGLRPDQPPVASVALQSLQCAWQAPCVALAQLTPADAVLANGGLSRPLTLTLDRKNHWTAEAKPGIDLNLGIAKANVTRFTISDASPAGLQISGTLSLPALQDTLLTLSDTGLTVTPDGQFTPTGTLQFGGAISINGLSLTSSNTSIVFADPAIDQFATISGSGALSYDFGANDRGALTVSGVKLLVPRAGKAWSLDLSDARTHVEDLQIFGHRFTNCSLTERTQVVPVGDQQTLCLGMHLMPGMSIQDDDVAYGQFGFIVKDNNGSPEVRSRSVRLVLPAKTTATLRLGGMPLTLSGLNAQVVDPRTGHLDEQQPTINDDDLVSVLRAHPICKPFIRGTVTITAPGLIPLGMSGGDAANSSGATFSAAPQFEFGRDCLMLSLNGLLPVPLSAQSNILFTNIAIVHANENGKQIDFASAAGAITSGNVTGVVRRLSYLRDDFSGKTLTRFDPDWGLTVSINAARNPNAISDTLQKAGSLALGLLIHRR